MKHEIFLYMSRWSLHGGAPGLALFGFDTDTGAIRLIRELNGDLSFGCSNIDREKNILYLCNETNLKDETGYDTGRVYGYRIDPDTGDLTELFHQDTYCAFPDYLGFTQDRSRLIVPHHSWATSVTNIEQDEHGVYHPVVRWNDSAIDLFRMTDDGRIEDLVDVVKHRFETPQRDYEGKPTIPHPHCAVSSPDGKLFAVCDKGDCHIYIYKIENDHLVQLSRTMTDVPLSEPRYCAFHPTLPYLFVNHEHTGHGRMMVSAFRYDADGSLTPINKVDCLPQDFSGKSEGQGFCISADGKYLYNQICGLNAMVALSIDQNTGHVEVIQHMPIEGTRPRNCALSPDGRFLVTTCLGGEIAVYAVLDDGTLRPTGHLAFLRGSAYISFYDR